MFGIDFSEILVIFGIALVVLGPEKLPKLAATIGRWLGRARSMARQFREQLEQEASRLHDSADLNASQRPQDRPYPGHGASYQNPASAPATPASPEFGLHNAADPQPQPAPAPAPGTGLGPQHESTEAAPSVGPPLTATDEAPQRPASVEAHERGA